MPAAVVNNCWIEYEHCGAGSAVVFIHGESLQPQPDAPVLG